MKTLDLTVESMEDIVAPCNDDQFSFFWGGVALGVGIFGIVFT